MAYDNTNTFVLFKNEDKERGSKQPDYRGSVNIDGVDKDIAGWIRSSKKDGKKFIGGKISEPYKKDGGSAPAPKDDDDSDIPF